MNPARDPAREAHEAALRDAFERQAADSRDVAAHRDICERLKALGRIDQLALWAQRALALAPDDIDLAVVAGGSLAMIGDHAGAAVVWRGKAHLPWDPGFYQVNLGHALAMSGEIDEGIRLLREAAAVPGRNGAWAKHHLGETMLRLGDPGGFALWLCRNQSGDALSYRPEGIPEWTPGAPIAGRSVLVAHQLHFGDQFLLGACIRDWLDAGANLCLTCAPEIVGVVRASWPQCRVIPGPPPKRVAEAAPDWLAEPLAASRPDYWISLLHLPLLAAASGRRPYFPPYARAPDPARRDAARWAHAFRQTHAGQPLIGLFWDTQAHHFPQNVSPRAMWWSIQRSLPPSAAASLTTDPRLAGKVAFVSLHHPLTPGGLAGLPGVDAYGPGIQDFSQTAAVIEQLDAVVTVDSAVANLSAMVGRPTLVLASQTRDWRWATPGGEAIWIGGVEVFAQTARGDWRAPVEDVILALRGMRGRLPPGARPG